MFRHILHSRINICWVYFTLTVFTPSNSSPASDMVLRSNTSVQKILYEVLSVSEDATYKAQAHHPTSRADRSAALNTHTLTKHIQPSSCPFFPVRNKNLFIVQKAWEILRHPTPRGDYDKQLQSSRQNIEIIASKKYCFTRVKFLNHLPHHLD